MDKAAYLNQILGMDPYSEPENILDLRAQFLNPSEESDDPEDRILELMGLWQTQFWTDDGFMYYEQLKQEGFHDYPFVAARFAWLEGLMAERSTFLQIRNEADRPTRRFLEYFGQVLVAPANQRCNLKNLSLQRNLGFRERGRLKRLLKQLQQRTPVIYQREHRWLIESISPKKLARHNAPWPFSVDLPLTVVGAVLMISLVILTFAVSVVIMEGA